MGSILKKKKKGTEHTATTIKSQLKLQLTNLGSTKMVQLHLAPDKKRS